MDQLRVNILASTGYIHETFATLFQVNETVGIVYPTRKPTDSVTQTHDSQLDLSSIESTRASELIEITAV
ncbi:hypothetical protein K7432_012036 [Basidiobolus ranarum]|uniref:Uncharacterized protein n=1 Tax=Basidiobolus ranarum TaxID=34480 RepID=A0ABR2VSX4_9FUNG